MGRCLIGLLLVAACGGYALAADVAAPLTYTGSCVGLADGGVELAADAGFTGTPGNPGPPAAPSAMAGAWRVFAPTCASGTLNDAGVWDCGSWKGTIGSKPDAYYPGGLVLTPWPQPPIWQYASEARVSYVSANEVHADMMDGYWGFMGARLYFCRVP